MDRFGPKIGAARIGATVYELPPGQALCPYHYESDEEWVLVLQGELTVRHPGRRGRARAGRRTCFPVGPDGRAQDDQRRATETVRMVMLSTKDEPACRSIPTRDKIGDLDRAPRGARARRGSARTSTTTTASNA